MARWDNDSGKLKPTWAVSFSPLWVFVGSAIAGIITAAMVFFIFVTGPGLDELNEVTAVARGGILMLGLTVMVYILIGPVLAWGVGFAVRNIDNLGMHLVAFALLGLIVGFMLGNLLAPGLGSVVAPASGIGAAAARWLINSQSRVI